VALQLVQPRKWDLSPLATARKRQLPTPVPFAAESVTIALKKEALLFCDRALGFDFCVAGENIRAFQISGIPSTKTAVCPAPMLQPFAARLSVELNPTLRTGLATDAIRSSQRAHSESCPDWSLSGPKVVTLKPGSAGTTSTARGSRRRRNICSEFSRRASW
jgi:hypothetical protein